MKTFLHAKIHNVEVTQTDRSYEGSITIDEHFLELSGIQEYEQVIVACIETEQRFTTYVIKGERGSKIIGINGAAAGLTHVGDRVIIMAFKTLNDEYGPEMRDHQVTKLIFNKDQNWDLVEELPFAD